MYNIKFRQDKNPTTSLLQTEDLEAAIAFIKQLPRASIGQSMWIARDARNIAYVGGPRWFESQQYADFENMPSVEYLTNVVLSSDATNWIYDSKSPELLLVMAANDWGYVNRPRCVHNLDIPNNERIDLGYVVAVISRDCTVYPGYPIGLSYDGGVTTTYYCGLAQLARDLIEHDVQLEYTA